jgi:hypothetical protein
MMFPKQYKGPKPFSVIRVQCEAQGLNFDPVSSNHLLPDYALIAGSDSEGAYAWYSEKTGHFFGMKDDQTGFSFNGGETIKEQPEWYYALLEFFLERAEENDTSPGIGAMPALPLNLGELGFEDGMTREDYVRLVCAMPGAGAPTGSAA